MTLSLTNYAGDFGNVTVGEVVTLFLDFSGSLAVGETLTSIANGGQWVVSVAADSLISDSNAANIPNGPANINNNTAGIPIPAIAGQRFSGMVGGCKYLTVCTAVTNQGNSLELWAHFFCEIPI